MRVFGKIINRKERVYLSTKTGRPTKETGMRTKLTGTAYLRISTDRCMMANGLII
jgi:hypothetical protein